MRHLTLILAMASAGLFTACGGSGSSPSGTDTGGGTGGGGTTPTTTGLTLTGVVAKGAALAGASITAKCATGTGAATATSSGSYSLTISAGALPCVLEATGIGADAAVVLHSVATSSTDSTSSATANITPLTELLVAQLSGQTPTAYMAALDTSTLATRVTTSTLSAAQTAVVTTLAAAGLNITAITNVVTQPLVAANGSTAGNAYDAALDALASALTTGGSTLAQLITTVASAAAPVVTTPSSTPVADTDALSLPPELLLKAQAANCAAVRSTNYRAIEFKPSATTGDLDAVTETDTFSFNATTLVATDSEGSAETWTAAGPCLYTKDGGLSTIAVSPAGVMVGRLWNASASNYRLGMALPVQTVAVADLAGTWNTMGWENSSGSSWSVAAGTVVVGSNGAISSAKCFDASLATIEASCTTETTLLPVFTANASGGFDLTSTDPADAWKERSFAYRSGKGDKLIVNVNARGMITLITQARTLGAPTVGDALTARNFTVNASFVASDAVSTNTHTITAVDPAAGTYTRNTQAEGSSVTQPQSLANNVGRNGYTHRAAQTVIASDASSVNVREMYSFRLQGMGLSAYYLPSTSTTGTSNARFGIAVKQ